MLQLPQCRHRRPRAVVLDHEIVHHVTPARCQAIERVFHKPRHFRAGNAAEQIRHQNGVLLLWPFGGQRVRGNVADAVDHSGGGNELPADLGDIGEIDDRRDQFRVGFQQPDAHRAGAAADIQQRLRIAEIHEPGQGPAGPERSRVLRLAVDRCLFRVRHPMLIGIDSLGIERAVQHLVQLTEKRVHLLVDLIAEIVAELVLGAFRQKRFRPRRIRVDLALFFPVHQADTGQRRHQSGDPVHWDFRLLGNFRRAFRTLRQLSENVDMQSGKQGFRRHETERDAGNLFRRFRQTTLHH